jgi:hypothetical protein
MYNLISCGGWESQVAGYIGSGSCIKARLGLVILFFIIALIRKWGGEEMGMSFSFLFALVGGILPYVIVISLFGSFKIALVIGIVGALVGGYGMGMITGEEGGYE